MTARWPVVLGLVYPLQQSGLTLPAVANVWDTRGNVWAAGFGRGASVAAIRWGLRLPLFSSLDRNGDDTATNTQRSELHSVSGVGEGRGLSSWCRAGVHIEYRGRGPSPVPSPPRVVLAVSSPTAGHGVGRVSDALPSTGWTRGSVMAPRRGGASLFGSQRRADVWIFAATYRPDSALVLYGTFARICAIPTIRRPPSH